MDRVLTKGVIVGLNAKIEYLLPFFYLNFRLHSDLPIAFFDFGMSSMGQIFCQKRGEVYPLEKMSLYQAKHLDGQELKMQAWFQKPLACQMAPFDINLWIDLDCLIRAPLEPIFEALTEDKWIAIAKEYEILLDEGLYTFDKIPIYNSGVFAFYKNSPLVEQWIALCKQFPLERVGDQDLLSFELFSHPSKIALLDKRYNALIPSLPAGSEPEFNVSKPLKLLNLELSPQEAYILHFSGNTKSLLLARYQYLENLLPP